MSIKPWEAGYVLMIEPNAVSDALRLCRNEIERLNADLRKDHGEPVAWIRFRSDGCYEGPIMHGQMEEVRKQSGAWTPLYTSAPSIPEGWQLVPVDPTREMAKASFDLAGSTIPDQNGRISMISIAWHSMLAAAPKPGELK